MCPHREPVPARAVGEGRIGIAVVFGRHVVKVNPYFRIGGAIVDGY